MDKLKGLAAAAAAKSVPSPSSTSNADIALTKRIAESKAREVGQQVLKEYCIELNKQMEKNVPAIIEKMDIDAQSVNFKTIATEFFDENLNNTYKKVLTQQIKTNLKQELRPILYDHFKADLNEEEDEQMGGGNFLDMAGKMATAAGAGDLKSMDLQDMASKMAPAAGAGEPSDNNKQEPAGASSVNSADSSMANQIVSAVNKQIMNDETLIEELKKGIIDNITSGSFKQALQNKVFETLVPEINKIMEEKIRDILNNDELTSAAIEVTKGQQELYNKRNPKKGGKKHSIKKTKKASNKRTRRH